MQYLRPAENPEKVIELLTPPHVPPNRKLFNNRFHALLGSMPKINAQAVSQIEEVAATVQVLEEIREGVLSNITRLDLPQVEPYGFARVILAVEEPTERDGVLHSGTEVVLALWGEGFESPVHGHAAGYIHEDLLAGAFDVRLYRPFGPAEERFARHMRTIEQREPGIFYSEFVQDRWEQTRSAVVHNFQALENSMSIHYLPEHVRNGDANKFTPFFSLENFTPQQTNIRASSPSGVMLSDVGAVFLVRSPKLPDIGEHYILITGGQVQTPRGMRREDIVYLPTGTEPILEDTGELRIYEVHGEAREEFYEKAKVQPKYRLK